MKTRKTDPVKALLFLILASFVLLSAFQVQRWDSDIFWALKAGEWIFAHGDVPRIDPFSYTFPDKEWIDFTWGFQVLAHLFYTWLGNWFGLFLLQSAVVGLTMYFLWRAMDMSSGRRWWLPATLIFLVFVSSQSRYFIRPHLFEFFFVALFFLLFGLHEREKKPRYLLCLAVAQVFWVNVHSSFILGIFMAGAYAAGSCIDDVRQRGLKGDVSAGTKRLLAGAALVGLATFVNPYGYKLAFFPLVHMGGENAEALRYIGEWKAVGIKELFFYLYPLPLGYFAFKVFVFGAAGALFLNRRSLKASDVLLVGGAIYLSTSHVRWVPIFGYFAAPIIAWNVSNWLDARDGRVAVRLKRLCAFALVCLIAALAYDYARLWGKDMYGLGPKAGHFPEDTVAFMKKHGVRGNMFNEYVFGGYLIYNYPEMKVFIDGRTPTVYSPYFFWTSRLADRESLWKKLEDEHDLTVALVSSMHGLCGKLRKNPGWAAVSFDDVSVLFLKDVERNRAVISAGALKEVDPCRTDKYALPSDKEKLLVMRGELESIDWTIVGSARPHFLLALVLTELGGEYLPKAVEEYEATLSAIDDERTRYDLGIVLLKLKRFKDALYQFERALDMDEGFMAAGYGTGMAHYYMGDYEKARGLMEKYIEAAGDKSEDPSYGFLGRSCFELRDFECAERYLRRAEFLSRSDKDLADIRFRLGSSLVELGRTTEGLELYRSALSLEPEYEKVLVSVADGFSRNGDLDLAKAIMMIVSDKK